MNQRGMNEEQFEMIFQTPHINNSTENILL